MSGIDAFQQNFPQRSALVDTSGVMTNDGKALLLSLWNRTGQGSGAPNVAVGLVADAVNPFGMTADWNEFDTVPVGGIAVIPPLVVGADIIVFNGDPANSLSVVPQRDAQIDALGIGVGYSLAATKMQWFRCWTPSQIRSMQLG